MVLSLYTTATSALLRSVYNRNESASYLRPNIWEQIPAEIKNKESLVGFK